MNTAILAYGIDLGKDETLPWSHNNLPAQWLITEVLGMNIPDKRSMSNEFERWFSEKERALAVLDIDIVLHGNAKCMMWSIVIKSSLTTAVECTPEPVNMSLFEMQNKDKMLERFCQSFGIKYKKPQWLLMCWNEIED